MDPFLGEIRLFSYDWPPRTWALCDGSLLPIAQYQALFALVGTTFGGNGTTTFGLPDLRGRVPMHPDSHTPSGMAGGAEQVTLTAAELPAHNHAVKAASEVGTVNTFENAVFASASGDANVYAPAGSLQPLNPNLVSAAGASQPHNNCQPSLVGNYCIALQGIFPSRN